MTKIYDRKELVKVLDRECLGAPSSSALLIGGHKVGKSELLNFLHERREGDAFYCQLSVDLVKLSDQTFLREFVETVKLQLETWIEEQRADEEEWIAGAKAPDVAPQLAQALKKRLQQLNWLRDALARMETILAGDSIQSKDLNRVFDRFQQAGKKVVLIIDEYDQIVAEHRISDDLFAFLRGNNMQKRIVMMVASRRHLMDQDLHPTDDRIDRRNYFNHFSVRPLNPFIEPHPVSYLEWLEQREDDNVVLTADERKYIATLGGGLPYFLSNARTAFITQDRPKEADRHDFENNLLFAFRQVFSDMWADYDEADRQALKDAAAGNSASLGSRAQLISYGVVVGAGGGAYRIFSPLFERFVRNAAVGVARRAPRHTPADATSIAVSPINAYDVYPTVLSMAQDSVHILELRVESTAPTKSVVDLTVSIPELGGEVTKSIDIQRASSPVAVQLTASLPNVGSIKAARHVNVQWRAALASSRGQVAIRSDVVKTLLLPMDVFLMARFDKEKAALIDFSWLIAAWVDGDFAEFEPTRAAAAAFEPAVTEPLPDDDTAQEVARRKVRAIWGALRALPFSRHDNPLVFHKNPNDSVQKVKLPLDTLKEKAGNCLDFAVLLASMFDRCAMDPGILLIPEHALVGWRYSETEWEFIEPTMLPTHDFDTALNEGNNQFNAVAGIVKPSTRHGVIDNPESFAILVDVHQVKEEYHVTSLGARG